MVTILYQVLVLIILALVGVNLFKAEKWCDHITAGLLLIPLILRVLMIR